MVYSKEWYKHNDPPRGMLGKKHSEETKRKMSISRTGMKRPKTKEHREKISKAVRQLWADGVYEKSAGRNHYRWRGGDKGLNCEVCGKEFMVKPGRFYGDGSKVRARYCSQRCHGIGSSGKNHHWWKDGITPKYAKFYGNKVHQNWRNAVFEKDNYTCQSCLRRGGYLHAHHIIPWAVAPEEKAMIDNGATLCKNCHAIIHRREYCA